MRRPESDIVKMGKININKICQVGYRRIDAWQFGWNVGFIGSMVDDPEAAKQMEGLLPVEYGIYKAEGIRGISFDHIINLWMNQDSFGYPY
ncbi:hypothetical protein WA026_021603 [Henosepilachna vigintioctopunctata]|uniref:Uncharacterized protein n=1 Tax=Henosepilachna vigintioctopunctata TaxID=420089 RepID=A0AAW1V1G4_9CUCU